MVPAVSIKRGILIRSADRFGLWPKDVSAWGNWQSFVSYTASLNPFVPESLVVYLAYAATGLEIAFGILLLTDIQTKWVARASGTLLLLFALSMTWSKSIKIPLDYSVFSCSAAVFALSLLVQIKLNEKA